MRDALPTPAPARFSGLSASHAEVATDNPAFLGLATGAPRAPAPRRQVASDSPRYSVVDDRNLLGHRRTGELDGYQVGYSVIRRPALRRGTRTRGSPCRRNTASARPSIRTRLCAMSSSHAAPGPLARMRRWTRRAR